MGGVLKGRIKKGSAVRDLGCQINQLVEWIESQFEDGMTWENYGKYGWEIDHIIPLSMVDLEDEYWFRKVCHFTNLRPMWKMDNIRKRNKI